MPTRKTQTEPTDTVPVSAQAPQDGATKKQSAPEPKKPLIPKDVDVHQYVTVRNGFHGRLIFVGQNGEEYIWEQFGDEQELTLLDLRNAKSRHKRFYSNNYFMFDDDWVIDYLGVRQFYKNAIPIDHFDDLFTKTPSEIEEIVAGLSDGQKRSIGYRARQLIAEGEIDSNKVIATLEKCLGMDLVEK